MYMMTNRVEVPITTLADGTAIAIIFPLASILGGYVANGTYLPFCSVASGSSQFPYAAIPNYGAAGPFSAQQANIITYNTDAITLDFI